MLKRKNWKPLIRGGELVLNLANGATIRVGPGEIDSWGGYVRVVDKRREVGYWDSKEWEESPELVMGAFLACAAGSRIPEVTVQRVNQGFLRKIKEGRHQKVLDGDQAFITKCLRKTSFDHEIPMPKFPKPRKRKKT